MNRDWETGDVAMVRGVPCIRLSGGTWEHGKADQFPYNEPAARPLVVIDPENADDVANLVRLFWAHGTDDCDDPHAMQAALREFADPKPPKPEEPTGLGAVVEDADGERWIRTCEPCDRCLNKPWQQGPVHKNWQIVEAVRVLSEGVRP